ncbi:ImmA/IrrE family metallo-endopeptidase, partial [Salmonella enterica subsp. enterica serovar Agona]|nr:ImmA/IrrE family metallo-endopeptidase [Salmonella enterica subsp. enterica serovar Agona]
VAYRGGAVNVELVAKRLGATIKYAPYEGEMAGALIRSNEIAVIAVNSAHHKNRQRFTIAHECGHLIYHNDERLYVDKTFSIRRRDDVSRMAIDKEEVEANQFAAELLMPFDYILRDIIRSDIDIEDGTEVARLAKKYAVSSQAMTYRIANVILV